VRLALADAFNLRRVQAENPPVCLGSVPRAAEILVLARTRQASMKGCAKSFSKASLSSIPRAMRR
jgi:hypothetical protein